MDDEKTEAMIRQLANMVQSQEYPAVTRIHVDIESLLDIRLGVLLTMIKTDTEYQYILSRLSAYENAFDRKTAKYFPALRFTEEQIQAARKDPALADMIWQRAPSTIMHSVITQLVEVTDQRNQFSPEYKDQPIEVVFCIPDLSIPKYAQLRLSEPIKQLGIKTAFSFQTKPYSELLTEAYVRSIGAWVLYDVDAFNKVPAVGTVFCTEYLKAETLVLAQQRVLDELADLPVEDLHKDLKSVKDAMNLVCEFVLFKANIMR